MPQTRNPATAFLLAGALFLGPAGTAFAAGDGGDNGDNASDNAPKCKEGEVWSPNEKSLFGTGKCVSETEIKEDKKGASLDIEEQQKLFYDYGKARANAGDYQHAIAVLRMAPNQDDPRVLNYLGFSHRKLGRMDEALGYYRAAIAADPDFSLVREYLGEAYIQLGLLEKAREQLSEIERICGGRECGEYRQLADLIIDSQITD